MKKYMKKLSVLLSSFLIGTITISNLNLSTKENLNNLKKTKILNGSQDDLNKLQSWHNNLTLQQDKEAKQNYLNSMNITTNKKINSNFDTYNITFNNLKLQNMLRKGIINQDVYNIWSSDDSFKRLTKEVNDIVYVPTNNYTYIQARAFQHYFYIKNNKMYFVDKNNPNPEAMKISRQNLKITNYALPPCLLTIINDWFNDGIIKVEEKDYLIDQIQEMIDNGDPIPQIEQRFEDVILDIITEWEGQDFDWALLFLDLTSGDYLVFNNNYQSKYSFLNGILNNLNLLQKEKNKYHSSVEEYYFFYKKWIDPSSIKAVPPINKFSKITDKDNAGPFEKGQTLIHEYDFDTLISYSKYDSLWEFLNSNVNFNIGKKFESSIGMLKKYKSYNTTFDKNESSKILKIYLNNWVKLTSISWRNSNWEFSKAELDLEISDNPWNKTINFNFKSTLDNNNTFDSVENWMY